MQAVAEKVDAITRGRYGQRFDSVVGATSERECAYEKGEVATHRDARAGNNPYHVGCKSQPAYLQRRHI